MWALFKKELFHFFSSSIGFVFTCFFLTISGLFLWVFDGIYHIPNSGFASIQPFFDLAPWLFLLLIPAATMQSFAEEQKQGTLELLRTKPIGTFQLVLGKFLGVWAIVVVSMLPTLIYFLAIYKLAAANSPVDFGAILGSYIALILLGGAYATLGLFISAVTKNQLTSLLLSLLSCFITYFGFNTAAETFQWNNFTNLGIQFHYDRISQGVLDTRDVSYFVAFYGIFLAATYFVFRNKNRKVNFVKNGSLAAVIFLIIFLSQQFYSRIDLTSDQRFSLSQTTKDILAIITAPVTIDVLLAGDLPPEFLKLQRETKQLLESIHATNTNVKFAFTDPLEAKAYRAESLAELQRLGLTPAEVNTQFEGVLKKEVVVPWALAYAEKKSVKIPLLKNTLGATTQERTNASVQNLEYTIANALKQLGTVKNKTIAVLKDNGQLGDVYIADYVKTLQSYYKIAPFVLDTTNVQQTINTLNNFDLVINAKPTEAFSEKQKLILDQHLMSGKSQLHLIDQVAVSKDSLFTNANNSTLAWYLNTKLTDVFFAYGLRVNPQLVVDYYSAPIILAQGEGNDTRYIPYNWGFSSLGKAPENEIITANLDPVKFNFCNPIDTLKSSGTKRILLQSSTYTKLKGVPTALNLKEITQPAVQEAFTKGSQNLAVLVEGPIKSAYANRILPEEVTGFTPNSTTAKLIVIADGDLIKNEVSQGRPLALGFDPLSQKMYDNKNFLLNCANYLLGDKGLVQLRAKQIKIPVLNLEKLASTKLIWQLICVVVPILLSALLYVFCYFYRRKKYAF